MNSHDGALLALEIAVMLSVALAFGQAFRRLHLPVVIGEIIGASILSGPIMARLVDSALAPETPDSVFRQRA